MRLEIHMVFEYQDVEDIEFRLNKKTRIVEARSNSTVIEVENGKPQDRNTLESYGYVILG